MTIVITGASGGIGGRVARLLAERGLADNLRLVVRDPQRAPDIPGAAVAVAEYGDHDAMVKAVADAEVVFFVSAGEAKERVKLHRDVVDAISRAGVPRIVYLSFLSAAPDCAFTFGRDHFHTEEHIRAAGLEYTFLRDSLYTDYVPVFTNPDGEIRGPAGDGRVSWVTRDDVAAAAAAVLAAPAEHVNATYEMTGPEAITMEETAALLAETSGREARYVNETIEEAWESRRPTGAPDWEIEGWITSYTSIAEGELEKVSGDIERLTGRAPTSVRDWLESHFGS
jgi:NAD(P)H dehydrogenase (quinone)